MKRITMLFGAGILFFCSTIFAAVPQLINFQGVLKDGSGNPVADGSYSVTFTIYDAPSGGNVLWTEAQSVSTTNGLFAVLLGSTNPVPDTAFKGQDRWLGIAVSPDPEMTPRQQLVSVSYGYRTHSVDGALGGKILGGVSVDSLGVGVNVPSSRLEVSGDLKVSGGIIAPSRPWFIAHGDPGWVSGTSGWNTVIYTTVSGGNSGGWYNTTDGRFTAPVTGLYWFHSQHFIYSGAAGIGYLHHTIGVNGLRATGGGQPPGAYTIFDLDQTEVNDGSTEVTRLLFLNAGDYVNVNVYLQNAGTFMYGSNSYYAGYLIQQF